MSGNVFEWNWDWWGEYTTSSPYTDADTKGPLSGINKGFRGGSFEWGTKWLQTSRRGNKNTPANKFNGTGFRIAQNI
jgi:formylglycine-generating enzyme required for sulfatase activity